MDCALSLFLLLLLMLSQGCELMTSVASDTRPDFRLPGLTSQVHVMAHLSRALVSPLPSGVVIVSAMK